MKAKAWSSAQEEIKIYSQLADLKENQYRMTLAIATLIDLLVEKGVFTRQEFGKRAAELDRGQ